jgi:RNA polymerase sigma-70 factor (family 1)
VTSTKPVALPSDAELISRLRADDEAALEQLVSVYWKRLERFVDGILGADASAEDVVQEAFIRLWNHRKDLKLEGSFKALLFTLTRNAAIDERRRVARRVALAEKLDPPAPGPSPLTETATSELRLIALKAVERLPERRREIFKLARTEGLSYKEISEVLGLSLQTVANQMSRALTTLHEELDRTFKNGHDGTTGGRDS